VKERKDLLVIAILVVPALPAAKASDFIKHLLFYSIAYLVFSNSISMHVRFLGDCSMLCKPFRFPLRNSRLDPYYNLVEATAAKMIVLWLM
jgi:hypothetical protein